jgi:hypothetical protein
MTRIHTLLGTCVTLIVTSTVPALAQGPTITSPTPHQVFRAGPDYATDVLHDPWDFSNVEDVGQYPYEYLGWAQSANAFLVGPSAFGVGSGKFIATNASNDPGIGLLYPGGIGIPNPGRSGQRYPVQTSAYRKLALRLKAANAGASAVAVHWHFGGLGSPIGIGTAFSPTAVSNGERIYQIDLVTNHAGGPSFASQAAVVGLRLDPINDTSPAAIELDWVRLTAADAPGVMMNVAATNCGGAINLEVQDVQDASGLWASVSTSLSFNYGILPPGNYRLRVTCNGNQSAAVPFTINDPPRITVLQPDERGGADYATLARGNPWDMDDAGDAVAAANLDQGAFVASPSGGQMLRGRNVLGAHGGITGDPNLFLLYAEGSSRPIASTRYRYLTFTTQLHHPFDLAVGSVARVGWASATNWSGLTASGTGAILLWPGRNTYTIDLGALTIGDGLEPCGAGAPCLRWTQASPRFLRFDPHEFGDRQVVFDLDNVTLAAPDEVVQGQTFRIQWSVIGAAAGSVNLYYDNDRNAGNGRQLITSRGIADTFYDWNVGGLAPGEYYISVEANETWAGGNQGRLAYSTGVLRVLPSVAPGVVSIATHPSGSTANSPFDISGCAYNGAGGADDEVIVYAHPLQGQMGGIVQILGHNAAGGLGTIAPATCTGGLPGYQVSNIVGLAPGLWHFRVLGRNTLTGDFDEVQAHNVSIALTAGAPGNFRASISGNTVSLAWDPPVGGEVTQYRIEAANNPGFAGFAWAVLPPSQTSITATLGNGTYYLRVRAGNTYSNDGPPSNVLNFTLPGGGPVAPPGAITLGGQVNTNPVSLHWSQAGGGAATYALHAGSAPGASNIAIVPMGTATGLPPVVVPVGVSIFARIVASNAAGSTVSNEVVVNVPAAGPPGGPPIQLDPIVSGNNVTLQWNPPLGSVPTGYVIVARLPGSPAVIAALPLTSTSVSVPGVPSGSYVITIAAMYGSTPSIESNPKTVSIP